MSCEIMLRAGIPDWMQDVCIEMKKKREKRTQEKDTEENGGRGHGRRVIHRKNENVVRKVGQTSSRSVRHMLQQKEL